MSNIDAKAVSTTKSEDQLQTKYFCQVTQKKVVEVVMKLSAVETKIQKRLPLRYVLVIDVSGSMDSIVGKESESLLNRVKIFAELVVENIANTDSLSIVTFSHDVVIDMDLTVMNKKAKDEAKSIIRGLCTRGQTNLEIGLMTGLHVLKKNGGKNDRDLIIVFTDGMANLGETDPGELINKYKDTQKSMNKTSCVPISAFTIGQYIPVLLNELAGHLGSDAFYWLNEEEEFEADMLIPVFLRETTRVTDVSINMICLNEVTFDEDHISGKHLTESSNKSLNYFIHSMPEDTKKHIPFTLVLPQDDIDKLDDKHIVDIKISYLDGKMNSQVIEDFVILCTTTLRESENADIGGKKDKRDIMLEMSAFTITANNVNSSWREAQISLVSVANEKCRKMSMIGINNAEYYIIHSDTKGHGKAIQEAILEINKIRKNYTVLLGDRSKYTKQLNDSADAWIDKLTFSGTIKKQQSLGQLFAMQSSIATEMPAAKGVFDPRIKHPYLPPQIEKKLRQCEKNVKRTKKEKKTFETTRVFKAQYILVSEALRDKKVGAKQETMSELIIRCGGTPVPNVNTVFNNTFLVCTEGDFKKNTVLVRDSKKARIPIVREDYIYNCIREKKILELEEYLLNKDKIKVELS